jgi:serine/threonine protein kinase
MAPEVLEDKPTTKASDIYSFSLILWALGACNRPFAGKSVTQLIDHVYRQDKRETITEDTPPSMAKLIGQCWQKRPENRPLIETVVDTLKEEQRIMFGH